MPAESPPIQVKPLPTGKRAIPIGFTPGGGSSFRMESTHKSAPPAVKEAPNGTGPDATTTTPTPESAEKPKGPLIDQAKSMLKTASDKSDGPFKLMTDEQIGEAAKAQVATQVTSGTFAEGDEAYTKALQEATQTFTQQNEAIKAAKAFIEGDLQSANSNGEILSVETKMENEEVVTTERKRNVNARVIELLNQIDDEGKALAQSIDAARRIEIGGRMLSADEFTKLHLEITKGTKTDEELKKEAQAKFDREAIIQDSSVEKPGQKTETRKAPETEEAKLHSLVDRALKFMVLPENIESDNNATAESARTVAAQLILAQQVMSNPPAARVQELIMRQALGSYQAYRERLVPKNIKVEDRYSDWQVVNEAVMKNPEQLQEIKGEVVEYFKSSLVVGEGGTWDEKIGNLVQTGNLSEAMVAIYTAGAVKDPEAKKHLKSILKQSSALTKATLVDYLDKNRNDISLLSRAMFGEEEKQRKIAELIRQHYGPLFEDYLSRSNKGQLVKTLGGMFLMGILGKLDAYLSTGVEPAQQQQPQYG